MRWFVLFWIILLPLNGFSIEWDKILMLSMQHTRVGLAPSLDFGTHCNDVGINLYGQWDFSLFFLHADIFARIGYSHNFSYFGIPGPSDTIEGSAQLTLGFGERNRFPEKFYLITPSATHHIGFHFTRYESTDHTSHNGGGFFYQYVDDTSRWTFQFDNNFNFTKIMDEYRTAALELSYLFLHNQDVLGLSFGFKLWTGTTTGLAKRGRGEFYDLSGQYGGEFSNGVLYVGFYWNGVRLQIGWDSEKIRDFIQNNFHYLINDGAILPLNREDRLYLEISLFDIGTLY